MRSEGLDSSCAIVYEISCISCQCSCSYSTRMQFTATNKVVSSAISGNDVPALLLSLLYNSPSPVEMSVHQAQVNFINASRFAVIGRTLGDREKWDNKVSRPLP